MKIHLLALMTALLPLPFAALEPARTASFGTEKRQAIFLRAESGEGLIGFLPEGKTGWRLTLYPGLGSVAAFAVADFDRDGKADLAIIKTDGEFATMLGDGQGGLALKSNSRGVLHGFVPAALQVEDLNGDGSPDLALFDGKRRLDLKNDGFGNLEAAAAAKAAPPRLAESFAPDFSGQGTPDRIEIRSDRVLIYPSRGAAPVEIVSRYVIRAAVVGDFSGTGGMELALISFGERPQLQIIALKSGLDAAINDESFSVTAPLLPEATLAVMAICCGSFSPNPANINVNDSITWSLGGIHSATQSTGSGSCTPATTPLFNSGIGPASFTKQFTSAGTLFYMCTNGPGFSHCVGGMKGTINVAAPPTPGSVPATGSPFTIKKSATAGSLDLTWGASCSLTATGFGIYEGTIGTTFAYNHTAMAGQCAKAATSATVVPAAGSTYYLIVSHTASNDGSYGKNSANVEIPVGTTVCLAQNLTGSC